MFKTGIYSLEQIKKGVSFKTIFGGERKISITLYDQVLKTNNFDEIAERILLFFANEKGAYKRTYTDRFNEFDHEILKIIPKYLSGAQIKVEDVGISDGRTAYDFFNKLTPLFPQLNFLATDRDPKIYIIEHNNFKITLNSTNDLLEIVWSPFVFNMIKRDSWRLYPLNNLLALWARWAIKPLLLAYRSQRIQARTVLLFAPKVLLLTKNDQRFVVGQYDILKPFTRQNHLIRAMNILNTSYFTSSEFTQIMQNIFNGLVVNGLFIMGSNQDAGTLVNGGIYQKTDQGFNLLWSSGSGAPIAKLLKEFVASK